MSLCLREEVEQEVDLQHQAVAEPLDDQGGLGPPKIFEKNNFF